jgi:hypothetical protein
VRCALGGLLAQVKEAKRIIWHNYAAAFQAALECVNTKESQDFAIKFVPKGLPHLTGEGDPPAPAAFSNQPAQPGSAWDDWCGEYRRKGNHPAGSSSHNAADVATIAAGAYERVFLTTPNVGRGFVFGRRRGTHPAGV